MDMKDI